MSIFIKLASIIIISAATSLAHAGFHFEPYLGFAVDGEWDSGGTKDDVSMTEFGLKMGYQAPSGFQVGGDIQLGAGTYDGLGVGGADMKAGAAAFGLYLGYQSPMGLRGYAHYLFASALAFDDTDDTAFSGDGFKLGVGYSVLPWLALNLEYHVMKYDEGKNNLVSDFVSMSPEHKNNFIFVNVSFPFNFGG